MFTWMFVVAVDAVVAVRATLPEKLDHELELDVELQCVWRVK